MRKKSVKIVCGLLAAALVGAGIFIWPIYKDYAFAKFYITGTPQQVENAIRKGADVNARDNRGNTPLMWAAMDNPSTEVTIVLIKAGADVNATDNSGYTPLMGAAGSNTNPEVITVLIKAGADVNARNSMGGTPLVSAMMNTSRPVVMTTLLEAGADVNVKEERYGFTPLIVAAASTTYPEVITTLLRFGADAKARDNQGRMAIEFARNNPHLANTDAIRQLEQASR